MADGIKLFNNTSQNSMEDTTVKLKDGSKFRKYRTMDGAIKYERWTEEDEKMYQNEAEKAEQELFPEHDYEKEEFDRNMEELDINGQLDYFMGNKFLIKLARNGFTKNYPGDSVPDLHTIWKDAKKDGISMKDFFRLLEESL